MNVNKKNRNSHIHNTAHTHTLTIPKQTKRADELLPFVVRGGSSHPMQLIVCLCVSLSFGEFSLFSLFWSDNIIIYIGTSRIQIFEGLMYVI